MPRPEEFYCPTLTVVLGYMISESLDALTEIFQSAYNQFFQEFLSMAPQCPACHHTHIHYFDHCKRYVYIDTAYSFQFIICRIQCENCHKISRILPPFIIRFKRYFFGFLFELFQQLIEKKVSLYRLVQKYSIDKRLLRTWKNQYHKWHEDRQIALDIPWNQIRNLQDFSLHYFTTYGCGWMQNFPA